MHGQFVLVALENDTEAIVGRITTISAQGRLVSPAGEDYALRQQREDRPVPDDLRDQFLKYRVNIRILGLLRSRDDGKPPLFVPSHRSGREVPVGTVIFDPDGEYYWPDDRCRPGLCDVRALHGRLAVFADKEGPSEFYRSFSVDQVRLDIRELEPAKVISLVIPAERQEHQNVAKLKQLRAAEWSKLVDEVWLARGGTDLKHFCQALQLDPRQQENEALAARSNMVRVVSALHDPSSQLLRALIMALSDGKLCVVDISQMRGAQGLALAGVILQRIFEHNQGEFTKANSRSVPVIAVIEEAQSVLGSRAGQGEGPFVSWVKEGRKYDLGAVIVTQ